MAIELEDRGGGAYPVVSLSLRTARGDTWADALSALRTTILMEYQRNDYLLGSDALAEGERDYLRSVMRGEASDGDYAGVGLL